MFVKSSFGIGCILKRKRSNKYTLTNYMLRQCDFAKQLVVKPLKNVLSGAEMFEIF